MFRNAKVLIEQMDGGFDEMNRFVRETICRALARSHEQYELAFQGAMRQQSSRICANLLDDS